MADKLSEERERGCHVSGELKMGKSSKVIVWDYIEVAIKDCSAKTEMQIGRKIKAGRSHRELKKQNQCVLTADWMMLFISTQGKCKMSRRYKGVPTANEKYILRWITQYCKNWKIDYGGKYTEWSQFYFFNWNVYNCSHREHIQKCNIFRKQENKREKELVILYQQ